MVECPSYVQKVANNDRSIREKVRYNYPLPDGVKKESKVTIGFDTKEGFTTFEFNFDFVPAAPTDADLAMCIPKKCETCLLKGFHDCLKSRQILEEPCSEWMYYPVQHWGEVAYYAKLHSEHYGEMLVAL